MKTQFIRHIGRAQLKHCLEAMNHAKSAKTPVHALFFQSKVWAPLLSLSGWNPTTTKMPLQTTQNCQIFMSNVHHHPFIARCVSLQFGLKTELHLNSLRKRTVKHNSEPKMLTPMLLWTHMKCLNSSTQKNEAKIWEERGVFELTIEGTPKDAAMGRTEFDREKERDEYKQLGDEVHGNGSSKLFYL